MNTSMIHDIPSEKEAFVFPASFNQQSLWFLDRLEPNSAIYNIPISLHLRIPLKVKVLEQSLNTIIERHEVLRTTLIAVDGQPMQAIIPELTIELPLVDLCHLSATEQEVETLRLATKEAQRPFDLAQGPLLRATLLQLGTEEYVLLLNIHHTIFDGWSTGVLLRELVILYEAFSNNQLPSLPELPIQYADYAIWQHEWLQGNILTEQLAYWKQQLAGAATVLELPTDRPHPSVPTYRGAMQPFTLSKQLTDGLKALSQQEGVTLYMTLVGAFQVLLHRYTGQDDILLGSPVAGRTHAETEDLIGFFINTLVLRSDLSGNPPFRELLRQVREVILEAHAHQDVPFEYLVKELQPERNLGQNPLFQALLTLNPPSPSLPYGWNLSSMDVQTNTSKFDLSILAKDGPGGLFGCFEYSTDLFDAATIKRLVGHWQTLLESIAAHPEQHIAELSLLTEAEQHAQLVKWNNTARAYPKDKGIHQLFEEQVKRTPDAIALIFREQRMTYWDLNVRANQLAHRLQQLNVGADVLVGIYMDRSFEMAISILGILKAGGAYLPLDPTYPKERLAFMLADAEVPVLLTQRQKLVDGLPAHTAHVICVDTDWSSLSQENDTNLNNKVKGEQLAYVIYTSGSTGKPKGVMISHHAICNHMLWSQECIPLSKRDRVLQKTPLSFDASVWEFFAPLLAGAQLIIAQPGKHQDSEYLIETIIHHGVTTVKLVPSLLRVLLENREIKRCTSLQRVLCGAEEMPIDLQRLFYTRLTANLCNLYGPTEATIDATYWSCKPEGTSHRVPIGHPIANTQIYILNSQLQPVPVNVPGDLYIGGDCLAQGYLNRPELTAERFISHLFSNEPKARLYKTGDLARYRGDGAIEFLGRVDHQVKLRGFRIELGEIEAVLRQHTDVHEAVVVTREDTPDNKYLVAYIVVAQQQSATLSSIQSSLKEKLPSYMIPSTFVILDALPLTPSGKIDRRALPAPDASNRTVEESFVAPTLTQHYQLIKIWEELLDARPIGIRDNFFLLGGHSLLATRLVARIQQVFGKKISLATLFAGPTIEHLTKALQQREETVPPSPIMAVQTGGTRRPFFFLHGAYKAGAFYCFPLAHELGADQPFYAIDPYKFQDVTAFPTLEAIAAAHIEKLRSIQPEGPYLLGGFCNGGLFAYEMARQLRAQGQAVDLLVLMEPTPVASYKPPRRAVNFIGNLLHLDQDTQVYGFLWPQHIYKYLLHLYRYVCYPHYRPLLETELKPEQVHAEGTIVAALKALYEQKVGLGIERLRAKEEIESERRSGKARFTLPKLHSIFPDALFPPAKALHRDWGGLFHWTASVYVPGFYPGKSTFFFFEDSKEWYRYREPWRKLATMQDKEVEIHTLPGTHDTCKTTYLPKLADCLRECLDKAQTTQSS